MRLKYLDLIGAAVIILFTLLVALLGIFTGADEFPIWFWPFGILMVLFIPGYVLTLAILPHLDRTTTLLLSLGISISMDILGGLVLHYTPWGLQPMSWALWLSGISLPCCMVAAYHRSLIQTEIGARGPVLKWNRDILVSFLVTIMLIGAAIFISRYFAINTGNNFTQLWALPMINEDGYAAQIGIHNQEPDARQYTLILESEGRTIEQWNNIELSPGQVWTKTFPFPEKPVVPVTFLLFITDTPDEVYRMVRLVPASFDAAITPTAIH